MPTHRVGQEVEVGQLLTYEICFHTAKKQKYDEKSPIMTTTITNARLKRRGYVSMLDMYGEINPSPRSSTEGNLPTAIYEIRTYDGVRGFFC